MQLTIRTSTPKAAHFCCLTLITLALTLLTFRASAQQNVSVSWSPNPEANIVGYVVYYGGATGSYTNQARPGKVTATTLKLAPGATYYFMVTAYNSYGLQSAPSAEVRYTVPTVVAPTFSAPAAGTLASVVDSPTSAMLRAQVNPNGSATLAWFEYGLDDRYGLTTSPIDAGSGTNILWLNVPVTDLSPATTYNYRVVATNRGGITYGANSTFLTLGIPPVATTQPATSISGSTAELNATVNPNGQSTVAWFQWGLTTNYGSFLSFYQTGAGTSPVAIRGNLENLQAGSTYHFRVVATNASGSTIGKNLTLHHSPGCAHHPHPARHRHRRNKCHLERQPQSQWQHHHGLVRLRNRPQLRLDHPATAL